MMQKTNSMESVASGQGQGGDPRRPTYHFSPLFGVDLLNKENLNLQKKSPSILLNNLLHLEEFLCLLAD